MSKPVLTNPMKKSKLSSAYKEEIFITSIFLKPKLFVLAAAWNTSAASLDPSTAYLKLVEAAPNSVTGSILQADRVGWFARFY